MHAVCRMQRTSSRSRRNHSARWRTMCGLNIQASRHASASCYCGCRRCGPYQHKSSNSCSLYDLSARRQSRRLSGTCFWMEGHSAGLTCRFNKTLNQSNSFVDNTPFRFPQCVMLWLLWNKIIFEIILKLFQCLISYVTTAAGYIWNKALKQFQNYFSSLFHM